MASSSDETKISLQVGSELRIKNNGDIVIDNPELELAADDRAAEAVLIYRFDATAGEHVLRLLEPVADHRERLHSDNRPRIAHRSAPRESILLVIRESPCRPPTGGRCCLSYRHARVGFRLPCPGCE